MEVTEKVFTRVDCEIRRKRVLIMRLGFGHGLSVTGLHKISSISQLHSSILRIFNDLNKKIIHTVK
jgi:hypothetical protein